MKRKGDFSLGDFGVAKTGKDPADFGLAKKREIIGRIVDLSRVKPGVLVVLPVQPSFKKRGRKSKTMVEKRLEALANSAALHKKFFIGWSRHVKPLEISHPGRDEILSTLEEIEVLDNSLKGQNWPTTADEEATQPISEGPKMVNLESYLWREEAPVGTVGEPDLLAEMLAEPDLAVVDGPAVVVFEEGVALPLAGEQKRKTGLTFNEQGELIWPENKAATADFFRRWRRKKEKPEKPSLISVNRKFRDKKTPIGLKPAKSFARQLAGFLSAGCLIYLVIFGMSLAGQGLLAKENILSSALQAYKAMLAAKDSAANLDFGAAAVNFETAYENFFAADQELDKMGRGIIYILEKLPGGSSVASGAALVSAGENLARAGQSFAQIGDLFLAQKIGDYFLGQGPTLTQKIVQVQGEISAAQTALAGAAKSLADVNAADLPADMAPQVQELKDKITPAAAAISQVNNWSNVFLSFLGNDRAKKYLLVFQNNSEARATGGFIGGYGVADVDGGLLKNLFIDNIFDLDGQLYEKITPPRPIQKISTAWSTHDANWFADFPTSAKKIMSFYEKAGGQTVDGVLSLTPTVIERLLALTGPIDMPRYNVALGADNFLDLTQYKVEVDYDKQQNEPKKILADFAPLFLDRLWQVWPQRGSEIIKILADALTEKHILFYFTDPALEKVFVEQGWSGEILSTEKDYLSVVNTNINGYKTDKVIDQKIEHAANVQADGSIVDTIKITRTHRGGQSQYDWYNKVNADYLRVYVPLGSKLMAARGQTLEAYSAPIDYAAQGFKNDPDVLAQEQGMAIDPASGTQIFTESGKTIFANWVFVSPGESVEITYQYLLPFKLNLGQESESYSLLAQKQGGSAGSDFTSILQLPASAKITWQYPAILQIAGQQVKFSDDLLTDKFYGLVFGK